MTKALVVYADGSSFIQSIEPDLRTLQKLVGGYIEGVRGDRPGWHAYCNEEGKLRGLPPNEMANDLAALLGWRGYSTDFLVGDVVFLGDALPGDGEDDDADEADVPEFVLDGLKQLEEAGA